MTEPAGRAAVAAVWHIESARIVGALARYTGDFALAEDVAQEALAEALVTWPREGVPRHPAGWLLTVGRRRAIDHFRRHAVQDRKYAVLAQELGEGGTAAGGEPADPLRAGEAVLWDPDQIDDDLLALMFVACHPVLSREARIALTLRVVAGLTSDEIAKAFLVPTATVQARITRAKKALAAAGVPFEVPPPEQRAERLGSVLTVVYLIFTEGSSASAGDALIRQDLANEGQRLARILTRLVPDEPEAHGLLALTELTAARFPARVGKDGEPVLLADQDRRRWDHAAIRRGRAALSRAQQSERGVGAYGLQAMIAECHAVAASVEDTDWERIVSLYDALAHLAPSPVVDLNRAVALSMARGPAAALEAVDAVAADGAWATSHLLPSVRGELLLRLGRGEEARGELERAIKLCGNERERAVLRGKLAGLHPSQNPE
ncbi:putative RNA polymerase, sigma-24 subunit, ECF subfamily [Catenulispora acidiphila DSM 44928]|uniref:Putative RNA polymerase, sigma-24 subunit, ECF subfamily n=1 Tax=Catenulispora acidiphila (strain DSM 44928 / JCM 14897 / NBRC 102108 / NRRL B-24433 / ID139908) TaxID=479433 RepID=C7QHP0_CATAD|nr:RNA polymerase sigma factor [Catenulispora acidiphila]ACU71065.1 putative RNA polymerase, sigma-24 subunit, ECF subfamily [Catenulispora acidiphila DSM 44928]